MALEVYNQVNLLQFDGVGTVTTTPQRLGSIITFTTDAKDNNPKTVVLSNNGNATIYFSSRATATATDAGGILRQGQQREFPIADLRESPYFFVSTGTVTINIEVWR